MFGTGLDGFGKLLLLGALTTLFVTAAGAVIGSLLGVVGAAAKLSPWRIAQKVAGAYTVIVRGVPDLLVIFLVYYGGSATLSHLFGKPVTVNAFLAGSIALGFVFGAYTTEIFRGALLEVPRGQAEAAAALGLPGYRTFLHVTAPQAWRLARPAFSNQLTVLLKDTSLISLVGLEDLLRRTNIAVEATNRPFAFYVVAGVLYMVLTFGLTASLRTGGWRSSAAHARG
jgi:His/Glu/Gln/Arg/opine family amino acid ABC transporter permease subunit